MARKSRANLRNKANGIAEVKIKDLLLDLVDSTVLTLDDGTPSYVGHNHDDRYYTKAETNFLFYTASYIDAHFQTIENMASYMTRDEIEDAFAGLVSITGYNKANWDAAYGWGNHDGLYYKIATAGVTNADTVAPSFEVTSSSFTGSPIPGVAGNNQGYLHTFNWNNATNYKLQFHYPVNAEKEIRFRRFISDSVPFWEGWSRLWHEHNDGAGSGLDADFLDGYNSSITPSAHTVLVRDEFGYAEAVYFKATHNDLVTGRSDVTGITGRYTAGGNYLYQLDAASVLNFLSLSSAITGSGTAGLFPVFTGSNTIGNSNVYYNSGDIGIGISPIVKFQTHLTTDINLGIRLGQADSSAAQINAFTDSGGGNIPMEFKATKYNFTLGNVGIGMDPVSYAKLHVNGNIQMQGALYNRSSGAFLYDNGTFDGYNIIYAGSDRPSIYLGGATYNENIYRNTTHYFQTIGGGDAQATIHYTGIFARNFADLNGGYNVNLGSDGNEGRGLVAGYSGSYYGGIGYNVRHTASSGVYIAPIPDTASYLHFVNGGFAFLAEAAGAAGRTISFGTKFRIDVDGIAYITNKIMFDGTYTYSTGETMIGRSSNHAIVLASGATGNDPSVLFANSTGNTIAQFNNSKLSIFYGEILISKTNPYLEFVNASGTTSLIYIQAAEGSSTVTHVAASGWTFSFNKDSRFLAQLRSDTLLIDNTIRFTSPGSSSGEISVLVREDTGGYVRTHPYASFFQDLASVTGVGNETNDEIKARRFFANHYIVGPPSANIGSPSNTAITSAARFILSATINTHAVIGMGNNYSMWFQLGSGTSGGYEWYHGASMIAYLTTGGSLGIDGTMTIGNIPEVVSGTYILTEDSGTVKKVNKRFFDNKATAEVYISPEDGISVDVDSEDFTAISISTSGIMNQFDNTTGVSYTNDEPKLFQCVCALTVSSGNDLGLIFGFAINGAFEQKSAQELTIKSEDGNHIVALTMNATLNSTDAITVVIKSTGGSTALSIPHLNFNIHEIIPMSILS